ncbi:MAG: hypothetical protein ACM3JC_10510 [Rudaea sp.]
MQRFLGLLVLAAALAPAANAQDIYKCVGDGNIVAYQNAPCEAGSIDAGILRLPDYADPPQRDAASAPAAEPPTPSVAPDATRSDAQTLAGMRAFPFRRTIALGITDDQVLNIADWGRPTKIARDRWRHGFRERWVYEAADGVRALSFVNGRLVDIDSGLAAPERLASLSTTR